MIEPISSVKVLADMFDVSSETASYCNTINGKLKAHSALVKIVININRFPC